MDDVLIIGGGPVGSTAATLLSKKGHRVTVFEKAQFPREHVGESLLPFCYDILDELGMLNEMTKRFARKPGVRFVDVNGAQQTTWCFGHVIHDESHLSFHVQRAEFDQLLLENARNHGATVHMQTKVRQVDLDEPDGLVTLRAADAENSEKIYRGRFLIDASGRDTFLAQRLGRKQAHPNLDRTALSTHWTGAKYRNGIEEGLLQIVYLGGEKKGWIWVIPLSRDRLSLGIVLDHAFIRREKTNLTQAGIKDWKTALYHQELNTSEFVRDLLVGAKIAQPLMINGNYSYTVTGKYGRNFAMIGDAASFIDPIFASGIFLGMNSARLVSKAVDQLLMSPDGKPEDYLTTAYDEINGAYQLVDKAIRLFYDPDAINFAQAGGASQLIHEQHENAMVIGHYLLAGDFFSRHQEYSEFLDLLQSESMFEKYKGYVIERPEFQAASCDMRALEIFPPNMDINDKI